MKIAYISTAIVPSRTANSINVMKMCQAFAKNGHQVKLFLPKYRNADALHNVYNYYDVERCFEIEWIPINKSHKLSGHWYGLKAMLAVKKWKAELIYGRSLLTILLFSNNSSKAIYELHKPFSNKFLSYLLYYFTKNKLNKVVVISQALKNYTIEEYKIDEEKIVVAHDGADIPHYTKKADLKVQGSRLKVGYVGHLYPGKSMEIISELVKCCKWVDFHIIGGLESDIDYWKEKLKNEQNIIFHGYLPHKQTEAYRLACDVLIAPYQRHVSVYGNNSIDIGKWMSPLKLFEYMASKKAILTSDLPVLKEVLENDRNALLCSPDDINEWIRSLERLNSDINLRNRLGENANKDFIKNYTWNARAKKILEH
ncbi:glycosyltransferase Family 4 family protein [Heliorestis convoluta]|uniref:Glycosyltransferase Family 4 family protein n=2 Tax=Heliorestis convoluta TaxID=356322 RepID=A0A5Q2MZ68_9FIRM|nr:glycosyltransferase Family 4 family protein [Heliorestis convoluta]